MSAKGLDDQPLKGLGEALFDPRSVALVGVSRDSTKAASRPLKFLQAAGFKGAVYPVNPQRGVIGGEQVWPSLQDLPSVPDHAFIMVGTDRVLKVVEECVELGVPVVTVLAGGFAEAGDEGAALALKLREIITGSATRLIGPSSLGIVNLRNGLRLTANAAFAEPDLPVGKTLAVSQSGSIIGALVSRGKAQGIGFAALVSCGNEIDLNVGQICMTTLHDPAISGYALFLETIRGASDFRRFSVMAAEMGKPIVAYKLGRSSVAADLAMSHVGAMAGEEHVSAAYLADCGVARVETLDALLEGVTIADQLPIRQSHDRVPRIGVVTTTGGGAAMVVDQLGIRGIDVVAPTEALFARLRDAGATATSGRIVDLTLAGARYEVVHVALQCLVDSGEYDLVVAVVGSSARLAPESAVRPIIELAGRGTPIAAFLVPDAPEGMAMLRRAGVASFRTPESCADAIVAAFSRYQPRLPMESVESQEQQSKGVLVTLDELSAYELLDRWGIPHAPACCLTDDDYSGLDLPFEYPVVAKVLSNEIVHKTDAGGVVLGIDGPESLRSAIDLILANVALHCPQVTSPKILVQAVVTGLAEVLVGYRVDEQVGPVVLLAPGGEGAELYSSRSLRLAPVDLPKAREMISEVPELRHLLGFRGRPAGDLDALASVIVRMSQLIELRHIVEAEINPLIVGVEGCGVSAVDAVVRTMVSSDSGQGERHFADEHD